MTTNSPNQPNHPPQQNGYNPITLDDVQSPRDFFSADLSSRAIRWIVAPLLGFIYLYSLRIPLLAPLAVLVLLGCLCARMDAHPRQVAAVPLTLAAIRLAYQMASHFTATNFMPGALGAAGIDVGSSWLPTFFSICLVYIPNRESITFKMILGGSCLMLASGLLPGDGYLVIFFMLNYTLFLGIIAAIFADLKAHATPHLESNLRPAH